MFGSPGRPSDGSFARSTVSCVWRPDGRVDEGRPGRCTGDVGAGPRACKLSLGTHRACFERAVLARHPLRLRLVWLSPAETGWAADSARDPERGNPPRRPHLALSRPGIGPVGGTRPGCGAERVPARPRGPPQTGRCRAIDHSRRRRVPGLRREEPARLTGVSTAYSVRFEQGNGSREALDAISRVLKPSDAEHAPPATPGPGQAASAAARAAAPTGEAHAEHPLLGQSRPGLPASRRHAPASRAEQFQIVGVEGVQRAAMADADDVAGRERIDAGWIVAHHRGAGCAIAEALAIAAGDGDLVADDNISSETGNGCRGAPGRWHSAFAGLRRGLDMAGSERQRLAAAPARRLRSRRSASPSIFASGQVSAHGHGFTLCPLAIVSVNARSSNTCASIAFAWI